MKGSPGSDLPYEIHTTRELDFMLTRGKPLAHFCDYYPPDPIEEIIPREAFAPHVESGRFVERLYVELMARDPSVPTVRGVLHALYAQRIEAWRIDEYIAMQTEGAVAGWSERLERLQGTLLGYSERENDQHVDRALANPATQGWPWVRRAIASRKG
jgi:hypothetical protein